MKFKVNDKVKCSQELLNKLGGDTLAQVEDGGIVVGIPNSNEVTVQFYSGYKCCVFCKDLELIKNQQLVFEFMDS